MEQVLELIITCSKHFIQLDTRYQFLYNLSLIIIINYRVHVLISNIALTIFICFDVINRAKFLGQRSKITQIILELLFRSEFFLEGHHLYAIFLASLKNYSPHFSFSVMQQLLEVGIPIMSKLQDVFPLLEYTGKY